MNNASVTIATLQSVAAHVSAYDVNHVLSGTLPLTATSNDVSKATAVVGSDGRTITVTGHAVGSCHITVDESPPAHTALDILVTVTAPPNLSEVALDHFDPPTP